MYKFKIKRSTVKNAGKGVFACQDIKPGELLGEYKGKKYLLQDDKNYKYSIDGTYTWVLNEYRKYLKDYKKRKYKDMGYIDAINSNHWSRFVNCSFNFNSENVDIKQRGERIYYHSKRPIRKGQELFVWYGPVYAKVLNIKDYHHYA